MPQENKGLYQLMTDPTFIRFNDWLQDKEIDFRDCDIDKLCLYIVTYINQIEYKLRDWLEAYTDAD